MAAIESLVATNPYTNHYTNHYIKKRKAMGLRIGVAAMQKLQFTGSTVDVSALEWRKE